MTTLNDIWTEVGKSLRRFVGSRVGDSHVADDITQDVMLKVQAHMGSLPPEEKLPAWVFAIARNAITDHFRARAVREDAAIRGLQAVVEPDESDRHQQVRELSECLLRVLEHLPEPYREAMRLSDLQGLSQQEIANRAGISLSGAKSRVQRARQQLREMLLDCCHVEQDRQGNIVGYDTTDRTSHYCVGEKASPPCDC